MLVENMVGVLIVGASLLTGLWSLTAVSNSSAANAINHEISVEAKNQVEHLAASKTYPAVGTAKTTKVGTRTGTIWSTQTDPTASAVKTDIYLTVPLDGYTTADCPAENTSDNCVTLTSSSTTTLGADAKILATAPNQSSDTHTIKVPPGTTEIYITIDKPTGFGQTTLTGNAYQGSTKLRTTTSLFRKGWSYGVIKINPAENITTIGFRDFDSNNTISASKMVAMVQGK